ncbi:siderophore-interacting protein [Clavibacter michiganensis]|nr:siderophore-interacting protein [Clavibacter michiganensis]PPF60230.1 siderophore-interacting protein [Clavibacter michiganensis]
MTIVPGTPAYRLFDTRVVHTRAISPTFVRVTLGSPSLRHFAPWGLDQRLKLILPHDVSQATARRQPWEGPFSDDVDGLSVAEWRAALASMPAGERHLARTYTTGRARPQECEVDIDFFIHHPAGPASTWASCAVVGDRMLVSGPDARANDRRHGIQWRPAEPPTVVLLLGDETAVPALTGIASSLGSGTRGVIVVEADDVDACPAIEQVPSEVAVHYVAREGRPPGETLAVAAESWAASDARDARAAGTAFAAWIAAESSAVPRLRSVVARAGIPRDLLHSQGYWNHGARGSRI